MNTELIAQLRRIADIAEAGYKPHWAVTLRSAARELQSERPSSKSGRTAVTIGPSVGGGWYVHWDTPGKAETYIFATREEARKKAASLFGCDA